MGEFTGFQLVAAGVHFIPAVVWAIVAQHGWRYVRTRQPQSRFFRLLPIVGAMVALAYSGFTLISLIPDDLRLQQPPSAIVVALYVFTEWCNFITVALGRHIARYFLTPEERPASRAWLAVNYGSVVVMQALTLVVVANLTFGEQLNASYRVLRWLYQLLMLGSVLWQVSRVTRPGAWAPGSAAWVARRADVVFLAGGLLSVGSWMIVLLGTGWRPHTTVMWDFPVWGVCLDALAGVGFAAPLAVRILGEVVRGLLIVLLTVLATAAVYVSVPAAAPLLDPELRPLLDVAAVCALVLLLVPGQSWLRAAVDHLVFRRRRRRREELQALLQRFSPGLGGIECCRRVLPEVAAVMHLRGAAILLRNGDTTVHGAMAIAPLETFWADGAVLDTLPAHALIGYELRELPNPLVEALTDTNIVGVVPIVSPRQRWGVLMISTGLLGATFSDGDERGLEAFADQLALLLDSAELLARALAVERSLAHAQKLAAIGELAARVAHEIRNPLTAARSLAQQLCGEPLGAVDREYAGLIVTELDRVERQVSALLRFARREEFHFEPVDLGELARATVQAFVPRLHASGIELQLLAPAGIVARADREKLRQALINLLENAIDALGDARDGKRLSVAVTSLDGSGTLQVTDTGPGLGADILPHVFEPFFSRKPNGTGLGLAIAKRTIEAHGGRIEAKNAADKGATVEIILPLSRP